MYHDILAGYFPLAPRILTSNLTGSIISLKWNHSTLNSSFLSNFHSKFFSRKGRGGSSTPRCIACKRDAFFFCIPSSGRYVRKLQKHERNARRRRTRAFPPVVTHESHRSLALDPILSRVRRKRGKFFTTFTQRVRVFSRTREYKVQKEREKEAHATLCGYPGSGIMDESKRLEEKEVSRNGW